MRHALQNRLNMILLVRHLVTGWLVEHAAEIVSVFQKGPDGKTAYERVRGKPYKRTLVEFAEKVHYRLSKLSAMKKLEARWAQAYFPGLVGGPGRLSSAHQAESSRAAQSEEFAQIAYGPLQMCFQFVVFLGIVNQSLRNTLNGKAYDTR